MTEQSPPEPTPGPWEIATHSGGDGHEIDIQKPSGGGWFLRLSPGYTFAEFPDPEEVRAEFEANAHLIAAAPETAAERDKLDSELRQVDAVLARRPALDDKSTRIDKIFHAIETAAERDRLVVEKVKLVEALQLAFSAIDNSLRSAGASTAGFIATRKLMAKAQDQVRAALDEAAKP